MSGNEFLTGPRRGKPIAIMIGIVVAAIAAVIVIVVVVGSGDDAEPATTPSTEPTDGDGTADTGTPDAGVPEAIALEPGSEEVDGVWVGYSQTLVGAVSAGAEYWSHLASNLDPDRAEWLAELFADPQSPDGPEDFRAGPIGLRERMGLPADGPVPAGVDVTVAPVAYQTRGVADTRVNLLLLAYITFSWPDRESETTVAVYPAAMVWRGDDWKIAELDDGVDYSGLAADPASPDADAKGWHPLTR